MEQGSIKDQKKKADFLTVEEDLSGELVHNGSVIIRGRILPGSKIRVSGYLNAIGGMLGADVYCGQGLSTPFIEMSSVISQDDILVTSHILSSRVKCGGGIYCSSGSFIRGGRCLAFNTIQADVFGDSFGAVTDLKLVKSDPQISTVWNPMAKSDPHIMKMVALKKLWQGVQLTLYDRTVHSAKDYEGPVFLKSPGEGG